MSEEISTPLWQITREIKELRQDIAHELKSIKAILEDISSGIAAIDKAMPNPLDVPE